VAKIFSKGDERVKHSLEKKIKVLKSYLEGVGIRSIERLEEVSSPLIIYWIRNVAAIVKEKLASIKVDEKGKNIAILEVDELFTYCKKNWLRRTSSSEKYTYGVAS